MYLGHSLCLGGVLLLEVGVIDLAEVVRFGDDSGGCLPRGTGEGGERTLLAEVLFAIRCGVREDNEILFVV